MFSLLLRYKDEFISSDGGFSLLLIDALLAIPLIMAAFFYPKEVLLSVGGLLLVSVLAYEALHLWRRHRMRA